MIWDEICQHNIKYHIISSHINYFDPLGLEICCYWSHGSLGQRASRGSYYEIRRKGEKCRENCKSWSEDYDRKKDCFIDCFYFYVQIFIFMWIEINREGEKQKMRNMCIYRYGERNRQIECKTSHNHCQCHYCSHFSSSLSSHLFFSSILLFYSFLLFLSSFLLFYSFLLFFYSILFFYSFLLSCWRWQLPSPVRLTL